jgi:hypothetical protein
VKRLPLVLEHGTREARVLVVEWVGKQKSIGHVSPRDFLAASPKEANRSLTRRLVAIGRTGMLVAIRVDNQTLTRGVTRLRGNP